MRRPLSARIVQVVVQVIVIFVASSIIFVHDDFTKNMSLLPRFRLLVVVFVDFDLFSLFRLVQDADQLFLVAAIIFWATG